MSKNSGSRLRIVTLDGQLISPGGAMTGGSSVKGSGMLSRANELQKLQKSREKLREQEKTCAQQLERAKADLAAVRYQLDRELEEESELKSRISSLEAEKRSGHLRPSVVDTVISTVFVPSRQSPSVRKVNGAQMRRATVFPLTASSAVSPTPFNSSSSMSSAPSRCAV